VLVTCHVFLQLLLARYVFLHLKTEFTAPVRTVYLVEHIGIFGEAGWSSTLLQRAKGFGGVCTSIESLVTRTP